MVPSGLHRPCAVNDTCNDALQYGEWSLPGGAHSRAVLIPRPFVPYVSLNKELTSEAHVRRRAGYKEFMQQQQERGADFVRAARQKSYQLAPRATIFRRDAGDVADLTSLKHLMRSNSYSTDPVSLLIDHALPNLLALQSD